MRRCDEGGVLHQTKMWCYGLRDQQRESFRGIKICVSMLLVLPVLLDVCVSWTLNTDFKRGIDAFVFSESCNIIVMVLCQMNDYTLIQTESQSVCH